MIIETINLIMLLMCIVLIKSIINTQEDRKCKVNVLVFTIAFVLSILPYVRWVMVFLIPIIGIPYFSVMLKESDFEFDEESLLYKILTFKI